jgi:hypothetical protein
MLTVQKRKTAITVINKLRHTGSILAKKEKSQIKVICECELFMEIKGMCAEQ